MISGFNISAKSLKWVWETDKHRRLNTKIGSGIGKYPRYFYTETASSVGCLWDQQHLNIVDSNHEIYTFMMLLQNLEYFFYTPHQKVSTLQQTTIDFVSTSGSDPSSLYRLQHTFYSITIYHVGNMRIYTCITHVTSGNGHCCSQKIGILTCRQIVN